MTVSDITPPRDAFGRPSRVEPLLLPVEYMSTTTPPWAEVGPRPHRTVLRDERHTLSDDLVVLLGRDDLTRMMAKAADDLARRLFADTPLALASIVRTSIVPWDIEYQTTTDGATFERVTRLVEYERGARHG